MLGPTEFLKAIADDIEQVAINLHKSGALTPRQALAINDLLKVVSDIREYTSTKVTTIAGTTVISTTTDETK